MRPVLTTEEIRKVFRLAFNDINDRSDDIISFEKAYKIFSDIQKESVNEFLTEHKFFNEEKLNSIVAELNLKDSDEGRIKIFIMVMNLVAQASVIKKIVQRIIEDYHE